jgi:hypothetical protein
MVRVPSSTRIGPTCFAGADDVDRFHRGRDGQHLAAHRRDGTRNLADGLTAYTQRHQEAADLTRSGVTRHDDVEGIARFIEAQCVAGGHLADEGFQRAHLASACEMAT